MIFVSALFFRKETISALLSGSAKVAPPPTLLRLISYDYLACTNDFIDMSRGLTTSQDHPTQLLTLCHATSLSIGLTNYLTLPLLFHSTLYLRFERPASK
jgi:hypothetical protein